MKFKNYYKEEVSKNPLHFEVSDDPMEFVKRENSEIEEDIGDAETTDISLSDIRHAQLNPDKYKDLPIAKRPQKILHNKLLFAVDGTPVSDEKIKQMMLQKPNAIIKTNSKMIHSGGPKYNFYNMSLPAYMGIYFDTKENKFKGIKTCLFADTCTKFCFASKGSYIQFTGPSMAAAKQVSYMMNDYEGFKNQVISEIKKYNNITKKENKTMVLRLTDSGDIISPNYLLMIYEIAKLFPDVIFYTYTKMVPLVKQYSNVQPDNVTFNFSFGGIHDVDIQPEDKQAVVVPTGLYVDLAPPRKHFPRSENINELKKRIAERYKVDLNTLITYDEMMKKPIGKVPKWNVIIWAGTGHGDVAATRKDVITSFLLQH